MAAAIACGAQPALPKKIQRELLEELKKKTELTDKEVKALYARFRRLAGPTGYLDSQQFKNTMGVLGVIDDPFLPDRMFRVFDINQDGRLSFDEFASSLAVMIRGGEEEKLRLSFDMAAGERNAKNVSLEDFGRLVHACNSMLRSLIAPSIGPLDESDIKRMFEEIANDENGQKMSIEDYKAAARGNEEFLSYLGLAAPRVEGISPSHTRSVVVSRAKSMDSTVGRMRSKLSVKSDGGSVPTSPCPGHTIISQPQIEDIQDRLTRIRDSVLRDQDLAKQFASPEPPATPEDPDERWWTPLPRRTAKQQNNRHVQLASAPLSSQEMSVEFERILAWFAKQSELCGGAPVGENNKEGGLGMRPNPNEQVNADRPPMSDNEDHPRRTSSGPLGRRGILDDHMLPPAETVPQPNGGEPVAVTAARSANSSLPGDDYEGGSAMARGALTPGAERKFNQPHRQPKSKSSSSRRKRQHRLLGPKKGLAVHFGHENWNMVLSMMIGIRMAVGRSKHEISRELQAADFIMKEKFSILPQLVNILDSAVSKKVQMTRFIDYAPMVFQRIRQSFGIQHDDYLRSVGPEQLLGNMVLGNLASLSELSSEGKSGAFFYYTADGKYMMKTVSRKEEVLFKKMLRQYYEHTVKYPGTLIVRYLGLHCLSVRKAVGTGKVAGRKVYFVVMGNMFNTPFEIHRRYDLKGSWVGRETKDETDKSVALKDVDFQNKKEVIEIGNEPKDKLLEQIRLDAEFLRDQNVIDYSLLLGIHHVEKDVDMAALVIEGIGEFPGDMSPRLRGMPTANTSNFGQAETSSRYIAPQPSSDLPVHQKDLGGLLSSDGHCLYYMGIIDILTPYDSMKILEHNLKAMRYSRGGISCCPPAMYADRFVSFMRKVFK